MSYVRAVYTSLTNSMFMPEKTFIAKKTEFLLEFPALFLPYIKNSSGHIGMYSSIMNVSHESTSLKLSCIFHYTP